MPRESSTVPIMSNPSKDIGADLKAATSLPVIVAPMFLVSNTALVLAACKEGLVGSIPAGQSWTSAAFEQQLKDITEGIDKLKAADPAAKIGPFAVNLTFKQAPRCRYRPLREIQSACRAGLARGDAGTDRQDPRLWRHRAA